MCLIIFDWQPDTERILTLASNRDEFYQRPSLSAEFWKDHPEIFGGRDLKMGGTWLAVSSRKRLAAVTNYRAPDTLNNAQSRGEIPFHFLKTDISAASFSETLAQQAQNYAGFNALFFDGYDLVYFSNRYKPIDKRLPPGRYGLSNHLLDSPWPKVELAKKALETSNPSTKKLSQFLLDALQNETKTPDHLLPDTGVGLELERMLSSIFISNQYYGTRASSAVIIKQQGDIHFTERTYHGNHLDPKKNYTEKYQAI